MDTHYAFQNVVQTTSTQEDARSVFRKIGEPAAVCAEAQTEGRGRRDRSWVDAPRSLAVSLCWEPGWGVHELGSLPLLAGLAAAEMTHTFLKWPNDVVDERGDKVGGVLVEAGGSEVTVGLGLNLYWPDAPDGFGALCRDDPGPSVSLARWWVERVMALAAGGAHDWGLDVYRRRCVTIGTDVTWNPDGRGRAVDIAVGGQLIVETPLGVTKLTDEVWHVRSIGR